MAPSETRSPAADRSGRVIPHRLPWPKRLLATLIYLLIRAVSATMRWQFEDRTGLFAAEPPQPVIFVTWHNRLALSLMLYVKLPQKLQPSRRMAAIVSASRDGAIVAHILELFGVEPVRGSTSRRGPQALLELARAAERGLDIAFTPDGPRGPCYAVQPGVASLAQVTGLPVVPACYHVNWKLRARSWDRFLIPLPFAKVTVVFDAPVRTPSEGGDAGREACRRLIEERLQAITRD